MTNSLGTAPGGDRTFFTPPAIADIATGDVDRGRPMTAAVLHGSFTADSHEVHYYFEWGATTGVRKQDAGAARARDRRPEAERCRCHR